MRIRSARIGRVAHVCRILLVLVVVLPPEILVTLADAQGYSNLPNVAAQPNALAGRSQQHPAQQPAQRSFNRGAGGAWQPMQQAYQPRKNVLAQQHGNRQSYETGDRTGRTLSSGVVSSGASNIRSSASFHIPQRRYVPEWNHGNLTPGYATSQQGLRALSPVPQGPAPLRLQVQPAQYSAAATDAQRPAWAESPSRNSQSRATPVQYPAPQHLPLPQFPAPQFPASQDQASQFGSQQAGETLTFNFKEVPWELALKRIAQENGMSLQMSRAPAGTFTFFDEHSYSPTDAIDVLNDHLLAQEFILVRNGRNLILFSTKDEIPSNLIPFVQTADLPRLGRNELASVAIPVHQGIVQTAEQEGEELIGPLGRITALSSSRRILVTDTGANLRRIYDLMTSGMSSAGGQPSFVHQLRNTSAEEVARAINEFLASGSQSQSSTIPGRPSASTAAVAQIVVAEKTTNSLLVRGTPQELDVIRNLVLQLDKAPPQVVIQALLIEVELGNTDEFGVELGIQDSVLFDRSVIDNIVTVTETVTSPNGNQTTNQRILSQTAAPGFNFNNQQLGNNVAISPGTVAGQAISTLGVGRVNGDLGFGGLVLSAGSDSVNVLLRALKSKYKVDILSRPQIRTLDDHEAVIQIGRQVPVVDGVSVTAVGSANPVIRQDQSGIILKVTPRIDPDGRVTINVNAEKSAFQLAPGTGVPIFTDATNGNVIEAPVKDITTASTTVSMQTGQTIALGGMITRDVIKVRRKVPFLGDIPYVGELFQYKLDDKVRKELLIFLTPHIVESDSHSDEMLMRESDRIHMQYEAVEQIHGPVPRMCPQHGANHNPNCGTCRGESPLLPAYAEPANVSTNGIQQVSGTTQSRAASPAVDPDKVEWTQEDESGKPRRWKPFSNFRKRQPAGPSPTTTGQGYAPPSQQNNRGTVPSNGNSPVYIPVTTPVQRR
jgi:type II secretory pathway component GspD/PulD (secretin)